MKSAIVEDSEQSSFKVLSRDAARLSKAIHDTINCGWGDEYREESLSSVEADRLLKELATLVQECGQAIGMISEAQDRD